MKRPVLIAAWAVAGLVLLTACAPHPSGAGQAKPSSTARASGTPSPSPTPTVTRPSLPADVLFQITVTAMAPGGATARLTETVHAPVATTTNQAADEAQLDTQCDGWRGAFSTTKYVVAEVSTAVTSGTWDSKNLVAADMAGYPVWTGDQRPYQAYCASALPYIPGAARAVSPVGGGGPDSDGGWGIYRYGFGVPTDPSAGQTASPTDVVLSKCTIQLGTAASDSVFASSWPSSPQTDNGLSCYFGGA